MAIDIYGSAEYQAVIDKINLWYGSDAQQIINVINQYELTPRQVADGYLAGSGFEPWYTSNGAVGGYMSSGSAAINPATAAQEAANSNVGSTSQVILKTPVETTVNQAGNVQASGGLTSVATGAKSALTFISKEVLPAVSAAGLGITLGKTIDAALYNANPDFWDNIGMSSLNPETWNSITADYPDGFLKKAFNTIFGLNSNTGETQMYLDQDAVAYLAQYMQQNGVFARGSEELITPIPQGWNITSVSRESVSALGEHPFATAVNASTGDQLTITIGYNSNDPRTIFATRWSDHDMIFASTSGSGTALSIRAYTDYGTEDEEYKGGTTVRINTAYTYDSKTVYYGYASLPNYVISMPSSVIENSGARQYAAWMMVYGEWRATPTIPGISDQTGATIPDFSDCTTAQDYLDRLRSTYTDLFNNAVTQSIANPDGTTSTKTFLPIGTPSSGNTTQPVTTGNNSGNQQSGQAANPTTVDLTGLQNLIDQLTKIISPTGTPTDPTNPDPTGTGTTPPVVAPTGQASALFAVYNPSQAALNSFGAWLWSSSFIDQVLKLFNNPMQSIIGLHKIFAAPPISGSGTIRVGYLDSGVGSNLVGGQYVTVNCGTVKVSEQFGNVFDYTDTHVRLYLPFIGIVPLDTADVMRGSVSVVYHVDVITGACLAEVKITRDGGGGTLYQYAGDAAVRYPISSGSYMGVVSGVLGVVGGIASAVMTGGATAPLAAGAVASGLANAKTDVQHSGSFAGNAGAMGGKKPYLIIERPQTSIASGFSAYQGVGANSIKRIGAMSGYFRMTDVHVDSVARASAEELEQIRTMIERGVIK